MTMERVQKILAQAGIASRRKAEEIIIQGLVTVNGQVAQLGDKADWPKDAIKVNGKRILPRTGPPVYLAFYKPKGVLSTLSDPGGRPTLSDYLNRKVKIKIFPIGRLEFNSEGLILLTNDGNFAEKLQKQKNIPRIYRVKVKGHPDDEMLSRLEKGALLGEYGAKKRLVKPHTLKIAQKLSNKTVIELVTLGGGAFDVKGLFELKGFLVEKTVRVAIGHITLKNLAPGQFRLLRASQVEALLKQPELGLKELRP